MPKKSKGKRASSPASHHSNNVPPVEPGPRKKRKKGSPPARHTTHKVRAAWFQARSSYPVREANVHYMVSERERTRSTAGQPLNWVQAGPTNIGGRMTSLAVHPQNPDIVYIGAAGGGVWRSDDAGRTWVAQWHHQPVLNVGSLAIDPRNPDTVYCGTGEANGSADSYAGVGLFRTDDGGQTWMLLASSATASMTDSIAGKSQKFYRILLLN